MILGLASQVASVTVGQVLETAVKIGVPVVLGGISSFFQNRGLNKKREALIDQQIKFAEDQERIARGDFTSQEITETEKAAEPIVNQTAASAAARLGSRSPAGVALVEQARSDAFSRRQSAAAGVAPLVRAQALNSLNLVPGSSTAQNLGVITALLLQGRESNGGSPIADDDLLINEFFDTFPELRDQGFIRPNRNAGNVNTILT